MDPYCDIASKYDISPTRMSLAWCDQVDGVTSTIIGATNQEQLAENIAAFDIQLSKQCLQEIEATLKQYGLPF